MQTKTELLTALHELKPYLQAHYKVRELGLFGSFARDEQTKSSDVDVLVDFEADADLFDLTGLTLFLEEQIGQPVDVVSKRGLRSELRETVLNEIAMV